MAPWRSRMKGRIPSVSILTMGMCSTQNYWWVFACYLLLVVVSSKLFVDKKLAVDNDGRRGGVGNKCSAVDLTEGQHPLRVEFFRGDGQASVKATYRLLISSSWESLFRTHLSLGYFIAVVLTHGIFWNRCEVLVSNSQQIQCLPNGPCVFIARKKLCKTCLNFRGWNL